MVFTVYTYTHIVENIVHATPHTTINGLWLNLHRWKTFFCSYARSKVFIFSGQCAQLLALDCLIFTPFVTNPQLWRHWSCSIYIRVFTNTKGSYLLPYSNLLKTLFLLLLNLPKHVHVVVFINQNIVELWQCHSNKKQNIHYLYRTEYW